MLMIFAYRVGIGIEPAMAAAALFALVNIFGRAAAWP